ncbi:MAG: M48 family metallopeptidase [Armatimonadetes bacterium]|nr:M48 family metallopeptidase [Armatimonadota bacterium]
MPVLLKGWKAGIAAAILIGLLAPVLPARAQQDIGEALERHYGVVGRDTEERRKMNDDLDRIVDKMSEALGYRPKSAKILGGKDPKVDREINAMALPDGRIYVLAGLMTAAQKTSDPEASVAFVVGHEIAHVTEKHSKQQMKQSILGVLGGVLLAKVLGGGSSAVRYGADIGSGLLGGHYSRKHEYESDKHGLIGMAKAGYPVESAPEMMQVLLDRYGSDKSLLASWFGSHPNTENRVKRLRQMGGEIKAGKIPGDEAEEEKKKKK